MLLFLQMLNVNELNGGVQNWESLMIFFVIANKCQLQSLKDIYHTGSHGAKWPRCHHHHHHLKRWPKSLRKLRKHQRLPAARGTQSVPAIIGKGHDGGIPRGPQGIVGVQLTFWKQSSRPQQSPHITRRLPLKPSRASKSMPRSFCSLNGGATTEENTLTASATSTTTT